MWEAEYSFAEKKLESLREGSDPMSLLNDSELCKDVNWYKVDRNQGSDSLMHKKANDENLREQRKLMSGQNLK